MEMELIEKAKRGDVGAFEELIKKHEQRIFNIAYHFSQSVVEAEDIAQDAIVKIFKSLKNFRGESSFSTWVFRIVKNVYFDAGRKSFRRYETALPENFEWMDKKTAEEDLERKELLVSVESAVRALPYKFRMVVVLCDIDGFDYKEAAEILKVPVGTIRSRLSRARAMLKEVLGNFLNGQSV